jgi:hypothetical protein
MALFSSTQREALLGPIKSWRFVWCRNWWCVKRTTSQSDSLADRLTRWPTNEQWPRLSQSRVVNQILEKLGEDQTLQPQECLRYQQAALQYLADEAITARLSEDDQSEFGYLCARYGAAYRHHEKLRHAWQALQRGDMSWTEVRFLLDQSDYARLDAPPDRRGGSSWR